MQKVDVQLEDDLTGGPADETVHFSIDGRSYEIDLNARNAARLRRQLGAFVERARPARLRRQRATTRTAASREHSRQVRAWAEDHGLPVSARGRLPGNIIERYEHAHTGGSAGIRTRRGRTSGR